MIREPYILNKVTQFVQSRFRDEEYPYARIEEALKKTDKYLFLQFRQGEITLNQMVTRRMEKLSGSRHKYVIFDDIRHMLSEPASRGSRERKKLYIDQYDCPRGQLKLEQILRPLQPWETNQHCIRSILK